MVVFYVFIYFKISLTVSHPTMLAWTLNMSGV